MQKFSFLIVGGHAYFHTIHYSIENINKLYPDTPIYIYDWDSTPDQLEVLKKKKNVVIVPWDVRFFDVSIYFRSLREKLSLVHGMRKLRDFLPYLKEPSRIWNGQKYASFIKKEMFFANKVLCMEDYLKNHGDNFIFLDSDAVLVQRIDELLDGSIDIGVTLREPDEINLLTHNCSVLNSGVLFFLGGKEKNILFADYWIDWMKKTHERFIEQTALTRLLEDVDPSVFENYKETKVPIADKEIRVKVLPCRVYNHYRAKKYGVTEENKIVHFKSLNYRKEVFYKFLEELGMPVPPSTSIVWQENL